MNVINFEPKYFVQMNIDAQRDALSKVKHASKNIDEHSDSHPLVYRYNGYLEKIKSPHIY